MARGLFLPEGEQQGRSQAFLSVVDPVRITMQQHVGSIVGYDPAKLRKRPVVATAILSPRFLGGPSCVPGINVPELIHGERRTNLALASPPPRLFFLLDTGTSRLTAAYRGGGLSLSEVRE